MSLSGFLIGLATGRAARRFKRAAEDPMAAQIARLRAILGTNAETEYGRRHGFAGIRTIRDYQQRVPIVTYEDIRGEIERIGRGAPNVLTAEAPVMLAQTSGTSGAPKLIPVTASARGREHRDQMATWLHHALRAHPTLLGGKIVSLVSPAVEGHTEAGLPYGSTSGHIYRHMPALVRRAYAIPYEVFEIADYDARYYAILRIALGEDVRLLATANPSSVIKLAEKGDAHREALIRDLRDGTLATHLEIEPAIRKGLERRFRPNPALARRLDQARAGGRLRPVDYWPNLALIGCWKGGTVGHYLARFPEWFGRGMPVRDWGYLASELRGSIPLSDQGAQGALTVGANLFELAPAADVEAHPDDPAAWPCLTVAEIEPGQDYYLIATTSSGLYRYDMNDVVRVEGMFGKTPEIAFVRKGRGMTSLTGEKVSVNQVIAAYDQAARATGAIPTHFKAEADAEKSRYVFRVELASPVDEPTARRFLQTLDESLQRLNLEYRAKRDSQRLARPVLHVMRDGWYERARREQVAQGTRAFQAKTELLAPLRARTQMMRPELERVVELEASDGQPERAPHS